MTDRKEAGIMRERDRTKIGDRINMNRKTYIIIAMVSLLCGWEAGADEAMVQKADNLQAETERLIAAEPSMREAVTSICVKTADGRTLVNIGAEKKAVPASNMKLITTGAALHTLGSGYRFETKIGYTGEINEGILNGDLYIIGGGDPTTGSKDSIAVAVEQTFRQWKDIIMKAGICRIDGKIIGDGRFFDGMSEHPTWLWNDIGTYYGSGTTGLMFYENMQSFAASAGPKPGSPVKIRPSYPEAPWMEFRYDCTTGEKGTGDRLYMYTSELAPVAEIRGTFGVDRAAKRLDCSNKFPEYTCASYFKDYLTNQGITCSGGAADFRLNKNTEASDSLKIIGSTLSPSLKRIAFETNHASNNLYAEALYRTLGRVRTGSACWDSCTVAMGDILKAMKINTKGISIADGSGLSRQNYVSADFFCRFLDAMMDSPYYDDYLETIPSPGSNGSLEYNMSKYPASIKSRIRVKSGSMNGVRCYSGYILPTVGDRDETIIFSIMTNNCTAPSWTVRKLLDKIMATFAAAN